MVSQFKPIENQNLHILVYSPIVDCQLKYPFPNTFKKWVGILVNESSKNLNENEISIFIKSN